MLVAHPPLADELGVHVHDDVVVFCMNDAESALLRQHLECLPDIAEVDHAAAARRKNIGGEYLERRVAGLDRLSELPSEFGRRLGVQHDVVGPVTWAFPDEVFVARLDGLQRGDAIAPIGKINKRGRPSEERSASNLLGAGRNERRAVGLDPHVMEMHVRVDAAWHDDMSCCVDQMLGGLGRQRSGSSDRGDRLTGNRDVTAHDALGCHHIAAANNEIKHPTSWRRQGPDAWLAQAWLAHHCGFGRSPLPLTLG
jgi:hypothetical protein